MEKYLNKKVGNLLVMENLDTDTEYERETYLPIKENNGDTKK